MKVNREFSVDTIWNDRIRILQKKKGYRFALDSVLLAHFLPVGPEDELLEIGAGSGVVTILLSALATFQSCIAVEVQPDLAQICRQNFELNGLGNCRVLEGNVKDGTENITNRFNLIYSNPPYRKLGTGKINPSHEKAVARHEIKMRLEDLFIAADQLLKPNGRLSVILPHFRKQDFVDLTQKYAFHLIEWRDVHSFAAEPPVFFLATVSNSTKPLLSSPLLRGRDRSVLQHRPLIVYDSPGRYTKEMAKMLKE